MNATGTPYKDRDMTLKQVGDELGTSKERARQIEKRAMTKFLAELERRGIKPEDILPANYDEDRE